jgi:hypothetical protein
VGGGRHLGDAGHPIPGGASAATLDAVACSSTDACTAVGSFVGELGETKTLAERWDGTSWTVQSTPIPAGGTSATLSAVSCGAASVCTAAGSFVNGLGKTTPLAERWDGTSWTLQHAAAPPGATAASLRGVSCIPAGACLAVGSSVSGAGTTTMLVEIGDGGSWRMQNASPPEGVVASALTGASCLPPTRCTAVGYFRDDTGAYGALVEQNTP